MSVRFLGRRVYLGLVVALCDELDVPRRTLTRWRQWWRDEFMRTALWQALCARFMPPVLAQRLPADLLARFAGAPSEALLRLLLFLAPLTVGPVALHEGR